jgi:hypothetical protein
LRLSATREYLFCWLRYPEHEKPLIRSSTGLDAGDQAGPSASEPEARAKTLLFVMREQQLVGILAARPIRQAGDPRGAASSRRGAGSISSSR